MRSHPHEFLSQKEYASKTSVPLQSVRKSNPVRMTYHGLPSSTPFAAQENNRGTSYHPHPVRMDRSVSLVQLQLGGGMFTRDMPLKSARDCGTLRILQIGPRLSKCTVSTRHGSNISPTWGQLRPARPQLRPNLDQLGSKVAAAWAQVEVHMVSKWRA